jgi:hypothetical protein
VQDDPTAGASSPPDDRTDPAAERHAELIRELEADPRFKKGGNPGDAIMIVGGRFKP